jgi:hypothetical protein
MALPRADPIRAWTLGVVLASVAVYAPTLAQGFVYDDLTVVVANPRIRSLEQLPTLVRSTQGENSRDYRPLTDVTLALNYAVSGLSPWSYHAVNVLLHALAAALLLWVGVAFGLSPAAAGAAALLFAIHPIHVECLTVVVGRKDVLAAVFALATVLLHRIALRRGGATLAWPVLAYLAAMFSKESGVVAVGLAALHDLARRAPEGAPVPIRRRVALYGGYAVALAAYLTVYRAVTAGLGRPLPVLNDNVTAHASAAVRVMTAVAVIGKGLALQLLPMGQSPDWSYQAIPLVGSLANPRLLAACAALALWLGVGLALRRSAPVVLVGLAWYLGTLLPVSNLLFPIGTVFGERLLYLPSAGLALAAGGGAAALVGSARRMTSRAAMAGAALTVTAALSIATLSYVSAWGDELRLFRLAAERVPTSSRVHLMLAGLLIERGRPHEALPEADRAVALNPWSSAAHMLRASALHELGRSAEEVEEFRAALRTNDDGDVILRPSE